MDSIDPRQLRNLVDGIIDSVDEASTTWARDFRDAIKKGAEQRWPVSDRPDEVRARSRGGRVEAHSSTRFYTRDDPDGAVLGNSAKYADDIRSRKVPGSGKPWDEFVIEVITANALKSLDQALARLDG